LVRRPVAAADHVSGARAADRDAMARHVLAETEKSLSI
jgi:hypothetical protein